MTWQKKIKLASVAGIAFSVFFGVGLGEPSLLGYVFFASVVAFTIARVCE